MELTNKVLKIFKEYIDSQAATEEILCALDAVECQLNFSYALTGQHQSIISALLYVLRERPYDSLRYDPNIEIHYLMRDYCNRLS